MEVFDSRIAHMKVVKQKDFSRGSCVTAGWLPRRLCNSRIAHMEAANNSIIQVEVVRQTHLLRLCNIRITGKEVVKDQDDLGSS